jgi:FixJ family two-component response regulator
VPSTLPPLVAVVEDDVAILTALGRALQAAGFEPALYTSAETFITSPPARLPQCLVLDVQLGGMSGLDLQERLTRLGSMLPVIIMTAFDNADTRRQAIRMGCVGYLDKTTDIDLLLRLIKSLPAAHALPGN